MKRARLDVPPLIHNSSRDHELLVLKRDRISQEWERIALERQRLHHDEDRLTMEKRKFEMEVRLLEYKLKKYEQLENKYKSRDQYNDPPSGASHRPLVDSVGSYGSGPTWNEPGSSSHYQGSDYGNYQSQYSMY